MEDSVKCLSEVKIKSTNLVISSWKAIWLIKHDFFYLNAYRLLCRRHLLHIGLVAVGRECWSSSCLTLCSSKVRTWYFPLQNCMRFLSSCFSSLSRCVWMVTQPAGLSAAPSNFVPSVNLMRVHSALSPRFLIKILNSIALCIDPWGTTLVIGFQLDFLLLITTLWAYLFSQFSVHLTVYSSASLWGSYGRQCWKLYRSAGRQHPLLSPNLPSQSFHHRGYQVGQPWLPLGESVLTALSMC